MLPLTSGPLPVSDAELASRAQAGLRQGLGGSTHAIRVSATGLGPELIERISVDVTGARVAGVPSWQESSSTGPPVRVARLDLAGAPVTVGPTPVHLQASVEDAACQWATGSDGTLWLLPTTRGAAGRATVTAQVSVTDMAPVAARIAAPLLAEQGLTLREIELDLQVHAADRVGFRADVTADRGPLSLPIQVTGIIAITPRAGLCLQDLRADSSHPLVRMGMGAVTGSLQQLQERSLDPSWMLTGWVRDRARMRLHEGQLRLDLQLRQAEAAA